MLPVGDVLNILNIYHLPRAEGRTVNFESLGSYLDGTGFDIVLGDFNLHIPALDNGVKLSSNKAETERVASLMRSAGLTLETTFTRGDSSSTIDLIWLGSILDSLHRSTIVIEEGFSEGDHRPVRHVLAAGLTHEAQTILAWESVEDHTATPSGCSISTGPCPQGGGRPRRGAHLCDQRRESRGICGSHLDQGGMVVPQQRQPSRSVAAVVRPPLRHALGREDPERCFLSSHEEGNASRLTVVEPEEGSGHGWHSFRCIVARSLRLQLFMRLHLERHGPRYVHPVANG